MMTKPIFGAFRDLVTLADNTDIIWSNLLNIELDTTPRARHCTE